PLRPRGVQVRPVHQIAPVFPQRTPLRGGLSMTSLRRTLAACTLVLAAPALAPAQEVFRDISSQRLENILQGMNIQYKKGDAGKGTTYYDYNSKGVALRLWNFNGKDLMIDAFFPKVEWETINKWNSTAKFSRARLDKNNKTGQESAVLESNLDLLGGVTEDTIRHFIRSFDQELTAWNPVSEEEIFKKATPDRIEKVLNAMNIKYEKKQQGDVVSYDFNKNNFDLRLI